MLSLVLSIYALPFSFYEIADNGLDGSWKQALNYAIKKKLVFGTDFVFTYGPLGFLSTRNTLYVSDLVLFLADLFLCVCFYHVIYKFLSQHKGWFFILLMAIFFYKNTEYSEILFFFFIIFTILNFKSHFSNYFEVVCCAIQGVLVFFIKLNYGMISIPLLLFLFIYLLVKNRRSFLVLFSASVLVFIVIYANVNINLTGYIKYGLPLILNYPDAMMRPISPTAPMFLWAMAFMVLYMGTAFTYTWKLWKQKEISATKLYPVILLSLMLFLMYKNGFTRADAHMILFFAMLPLFIVFAMFLFGFNKFNAAKIICLCTVVITYINEVLPNENENEFIKNLIIHSAPADYFSTLFKDQPVPENARLNIPDDKLRLIWGSSMDIFPVYCSIPLLNGLNYDPRPCIQSYSAYSPLLDSLDADHFIKTGRPEFVMLWNWTIDKYTQWDEPLTYATLHLNYDYFDFVSFRKDTMLQNNDGNYLLLKSKSGTHVYPKFERLYERIVNMEDSVHIDFPGDQAIYMTADIEYSAAGKIINLIFQPPLIAVNFFLDSTLVLARVVRPLLKEPVLINKTVYGNREFKNFITGNLKQNHTIKAFAFRATGDRCEKEIKLTFYRFINY